MERNQLLQQVADMRKELFDQGYIDEKFIQLEGLKDDAGIDFVEFTVKKICFDGKHIKDISLAMNDGPDFGKLETLVQEFMNRMTSLGAKRVKTECTTFQTYLENRDFEGCKKTFEKVKQEHDTLKEKLESYFELAKQAC